VSKLASGFSNVQRYFDVLAGMKIANIIAYKPFNHKNTSELKSTYLK